jgi:uncharacterized membrane protein
MSEFSNLRMTVDIYNYVNIFKFMWNLLYFCTLIAFINYTFTGVKIFHRSSGEKWNTYFDTMNFFHTHKTFKAK